MNEDETQQTHSKDAEMKDLDFEIPSKEQNIHSENNDLEFNQDYDYTQNNPEH